MGSIIAITNQKGGVGKTTTAINLAASLAASERRVLLIDGDPQGNASSGVGLTPDTVQATLYDVLIDGSDPREAIRHAVHFPSLDVLAATPDLAGAEVELVGEVGRELVLRRAIEALRGDYDFVLIDCPPSLGLLTVNMLSAADSLIIPLQCEYFALEGLTQLLRTVNLVQQRLNSGLRVFGVLLTMYDARLNLSRQVADDAREYFGTLVFNTIIPRNIRLAEAPSFGRPIVTYDIASVGSSAYLSLAKEVIERSRTDGVFDTALAQGRSTITPHDPVSLPPAPVRPEPVDQPNATPTDLHKDIEASLEPVGHKSDRSERPAEPAGNPTNHPVDPPAHFSNQEPDAEPMVDQLGESPEPPLDQPSIVPSDGPAQALPDHPAHVAAHEHPVPLADQAPPAPTVQSAVQPADQPADQLDDRPAIHLGDNPAATTAP